MKLQKTIILIGLVGALTLMGVGPAVAGSYSVGVGYSSGYRSSRHHHYHGGYYYRPSWSFGYTWGTPMYYWYPPPVVYYQYYSAPRPVYRRSPPVHYYEGGRFYTY